MSTPATEQEKTAALADMLKRFLGPVSDLDNAMCHRGVTSISYCPRCQREIEARQLLQDLEL